MAEYVREIRRLSRYVAESPGIQDWLKESCLAHAWVEGKILSEPRIEIVPFPNEDSVILRAVVDIERDKDHHGTV